MYSTSPQRSQHLLWSRHGKHQKGQHKAGGAPEKAPSKRTAECRNLLSRLSAKVLICVLHPVVSVRLPRASSASHAKSRSAAEMNAFRCTTSPSMPCEQLFNSHGLSFAMTIQ
jgi:hypothetical protein